MRPRILLPCLILCAATIGTVFGGVASANRLSLNESILARTATTALFEDGSGELRISCPVTLEGTFTSRTFSKVRGSAVGNLNEAIAESSCTGAGTVRLGEGVPYRIDYESFEGTLPSITGVRFQPPAPPELTNFYSAIPFVICTYRWEGDRSMVRIAPVNGVMMVITENLFRLVPNSYFLCPGFLVTTIRQPAQTPGRTELRFTLI